MSDLTPLFPSSRILRYELQTRLELEAATMRLASVTGGDLESVLVEVARREKVFAEVRRGSPHHGEHPKLAALESVTHDVVLGRFA